MKSIYIFARQIDGEEAILFEGRHSIPFFWLMLMGPEDVKSCCEKMDRIPKDSAEQIDTSVSLDKLKAISRAAGRRSYVEQHFTTCLPLYDDWILFMQTSDFSDMKIYMNLYGVSSCDVDQKHFADGLLKAITGFDENREAWYEDTIAGTCGYEGRNKNKKRFAETSKAYQELNKKDIYGRFDKKIHLDRKMSWGKKIKWAVLMLILAASLIAAGMYFLSR
jgi:hypothetical protein